MKKKKNAAFQNVIKTHSISSIRAQKLSPNQPTNQAVSYITIWDRTNYSHQIFKSIVSDSNDKDFSVPKKKKCNFVFYKRKRFLEQKKIGSTKNARTSRKSNTKRKKKNCVSNRKLQFSYAWHSYWCTMHK